MTPRIEDPLTLLIDEVSRSRKYRDLHLPENTLRDLLEQELPRHRTQKDALDAVRKKLHNIIAPYLGDPDYEQAALRLSAAHAADDPAEVAAVCREILSAHASTRERLPILTEFYQRIFAVTGTPSSILDLACGLNPFALPWMDLPAACDYHAYDIHEPRVRLINHFLRLQNHRPLAEMHDVLVDPPQVEADVAFLFKEAHRMEQRQHGCSRPFWQALRVRHLLVSLPTSNLSGRFDLLERQRALVHTTLEGLDWPVQEVLVGNEMVFCIQTGYETHKA